MKILFITDLYPLKKDDTIPNAIKEFVLALREKNNDVFTVRPNFLINTIIRNHKIFKSGIYLEDGVKIYNKNFILPFLNNNISFLDENFDIIISHLPSGNIYASLINEKLKLPHIAILHQSDYKVLSDFKYAFYFKNRLKKALLKANLIGARNKFLKEKLRADFILPSFVNQKTIINKKEFKNDKLKIITLSRLIKRKNLDLVIKALSKFEYDFEYNIFGKGKEKKRLEGLIKKLNLEDKVKINDYLNHNEIYSKLDENDVFILPSVDESFGIAYLEALSRGLIVIGTKNTGIDGIVEDGADGFLVEPTEDGVLDGFRRIVGANKGEISKKAVKRAWEFEKERVLEKYMEMIYKAFNAD